MKIIPPQKLWQWDINKKVYISGIADADEWQVHFAADDDCTALVLPIKHDDSGYWAYIPNQLVSEGRMLLCYLYNQTEERACTETMVKIPVIRRPRPEGYVLMPSVVGGASVLDIIGDLSALTTSSKGNLVDALNEVNLKEHNALLGRANTQAHPISSITGLEAHLRRLVANIADHNRTITELERDVGTLESASGAQGKALAQMQSSVDTIVSNSEAQQSAIDTIEVQISNIKDMGNAQAAAIDGVKRDVMRLIDSDTALVIEMTALKRDCDAMGETVAGTEAKLADYYKKTETYSKTEVDTALNGKQPIGNYVTSVNGNAPDKSGNVNIDVQTYTAGDGISIDEGEISVKNPMDDGVVSPATTWSSARIAGVLEQAGVIRKYGILWDKVEAACTRLWDAAGITTDTSNFGHFGSVNPNYNNPFDSIYPWSERRVCNYDMRVLKTIVADGYDVLDAVTVWEGEETFSYDPAEGLGVGVYTPEFWYTAYDTAEGRVFGVSGAPIEGWYYSEPIIAGRWLGVVEQLDGVSVLGCRVGIPTSNVAIGTLHTYAENASMTIDDVYSWDAETVLQIVEYANMNTQIATGNGVSSLYRQNATDLIMEDATDSTVVKVVAANAAYVIPGAIMDIGTSNGGTQVGQRYVISTAADETDETLLCVTLDEPVTVTTANFWSIHGLINVADAEIGSASGYIGTNGRCNAYYRGRVTAGNKFQYCLGVHREGQTNKIWVVPTRYQAETVLLLDTSVCIDTGCTLPWAEGNAAIGGYIGELALADGIAAFPLCSALGGSSSKPVGDYTYIPAKGGNTVSALGGYAINGSSAGRFCAHWGYSRGSSSWYLAASPSTKTAFRS